MATRFRITEHLNPREISELVDTTPRLRELTTRMAERHGLPETRARRVVERLLRESLPADTILNINVPDLPLEEIAGIEATRLGHRHQVYGIDRKHAQAIELLGRDHCADLGGGR